MDHFDFDAIVRDMPDARGFPAEWIKPIEAVQAEREARAQAMQAQQLADDLGQGAEMASKVVPLLQNQQRSAA
jgi:hypothetical protein